MLEHVTVFPWPLPVKGFICKNLPSWHRLHQYGENSVNIIPFRDANDIWLTNNDVTSSLRELCLQN